MFKYNAVACLICVWFSIEVLGAAIEAQDEDGKKIIEYLRKTELIDTEIENFLIVHRKYDNLTNSSVDITRAKYVSVFNIWSFQMNK